MSPRDLLCVFLAVVAASPLVQLKIIDVRRRRALAAFGRERGSRALALVHRQETVAVLGLPFFRYVTRPDAAELCGAVLATPAGTPIDLVVHLPGGLSYDASPLAAALSAHPATVTLFVPACALTAGRELAAAADRIIVADAAVLGGPVPHASPDPGAETGLPARIVAFLALHDQPPRRRPSRLYVPLARSGRER